MTKATELVLTSTGLVVADTGQALDEHSEDGEIVAALAWIRGAEARLDALKREYSAILVARMDKRAEWTVHSGGVKVSAPSPQAAGYTWDGEALRKVLAKFVAAGKIDQEAADRCFGTPKAPPVAVRGVNALLATLGKRDQNSVRACRVQKAAPTRTVSVS